MPITLKIISYQRLTPGQQDSFESNLDRFSIGRNPDNHWALPDPQRFMSGTHCWIENRDGKWFLTDTSTNGVFINGSDQRVPKGDSLALNHGDRIRLGDYELKLDLEGLAAGLGSPESVTPAKPFDPFHDDDETGIDRPAALEPFASSVPKDQKAPNTPLSHLDKNMLDGGVNIDQLHKLDEVEEEFPPSLASQGEQASPLRHHFSAPEAANRPADPLEDNYEAGANVIPDDWDVKTGLSRSPLTEDLVPPPSSPLKPAMDAPPPTPGPQSSATPTAAPRQAPPTLQATPGSAIGAFAAGAGIDPSQLHAVNEEEFFHDLGTLLKTITEGLMQTLASRREIKREFRIEQTMISPTQNNPLKFSVSAEEAIARLVSSGDRAYLSGSAAAADAIDDINAHQMAVLAGTEAALKSILRRFRPASMESKFGSGSALSKALPMLKNARSWEFYKVLYDEVSEAADDDFQQFFGSEFSSAYEKQLDRLKISRKDSSS